MASDSTVFWDGFLHERFGAPRNTLARTCTVCNERVRTDTPTRVADATGYGHDVDCHSADYAQGLGLDIGSMQAPGIALTSHTFWFAFLRDTDRGSERATVKVCRVCEGVLRVAEPNVINYSGDGSEIGHDPDCLALAFGTALGVATGGGGGGAELGPMFGESAPVFGSSEPVFGGS